MENWKTSRPDYQTYGTVEVVDENNIYMLTDLFNAVYKKLKTPDDSMTSAYIPIPKLNLKSHTLKFFIKIIHNRINTKWDHDISNPVFNLNVLTTTLLKCEQKYLFMLYILWKAFDTITQNSTFIENLHDHQRTYMKVGSTK